MEMAPNQNISEYKLNDPNETGYETLLVILPSFFYTFVAVIIESIMNPHRKTKFFMEFCILIIPLIFGMTLLADYYMHILYSLISTVMILMMWLYYREAKYEKTKKEPIKVKSSINYVTNARSTINTLAVIAILAVDFNIFPLRYAKTVTRGYSLMDTGVGLYVYSNGIVSPEAMGKSNSITKSFKASIPLFVLGIGRHISTKILNYNVSVSEYGIHWNFFITLAVTKLCSSIWLNIFKVKHIYWNAFILTLFYQILLKSGVEEFVLDENVDRDTFIKANREGVVSSLGFLILYLFSVHFGTILDLKGSNSAEKLKLRLKKVILVALMSLFISIIFQQFFGISRRLANPAYCFWILFIGTFMTGLFLILQVIQQSDIFTNTSGIVFSPYIYEAVNYNGLIFFLVGNLLTGFVNMSLDTLNVNNIISLLIINTYMFLNCGIVCILYSWQYKFKL